MSPAQRSLYALRLLYPRHIYVVILTDRVGNLTKMSNFDWIIGEEWDATQTAGRILAEWVCHFHLASTARMEFGDLVQSIWPSEEMGSQPPPSLGVMDL